MSFRRRGLIVAVLFVSSAFAANMASAFDPAFGFMYGYSMGQINQFRNRLPAPPYFAVYPPVYYGERYARPYGESPFASWPLLSAGDDYRVRPHMAPVSYPNPHAAGNNECVESAPLMTSDDSAPVEGKFVTIDNPFATGNRSIASR